MLVLKKKGLNFRLEPTRQQGCQQSVSSFTHKQVIFRWNLKAAADINDISILCSSFSGKIIDSFKRGGVGWICCPNWGWIQNLLELSNSATQKLVFRFCVQFFKVVQFCLFEGLNLKFGARIEVGKKFDWIFEIDDLKQHCSDTLSSFSAESTWRSHVWILEPKSRSDEKYGRIFKISNLSSLETENLFRYVV